MQNNLKRAHLTLFELFLFLQTFKNGPKGEYTKILICPTTDAEYHEECSFTFVLTYFY